MNEFQRFEQLIIAAFKKHSAVMDFSGMTMRNATEDDILAKQTLVDYCIDGLMDIKYDDQIIEEISNHIKHEIAPAFESHIKKMGSVNTLRYTDEYHNAMIIADKNSLDRNAVVEIVTDNNIFYILPYCQKTKEIIKGVIEKEEFRFAIVVINK